MLKVRKYVDKFVLETLFEDFYFFNVGHEICQPNHSYGPDLREKYLVHYIVEGEGVLETKGIRYTLTEGDFFLLRPNEVAFYQADDSDPWTYFWFGFDGTKVEEILGMNGILKGDCVGQVKETEKINRLFEKIFNANLFDISEKLTIQGHFLKLFEHFTINENTMIAQNVETRNQRYSESFLLYIQNNYYHESMTIAEIADSMNLNSSYLTQVIKAELKMTPIDYLTEYRMGKAKVLLASSDLSVYEVAEKVGYKSSHSFSRVFKQKVKCTPTEYAKKQKN